MIKGQQAGAMAFLNDWYASTQDKLAVLKGYAGTGKTWLVGYWLETHVFKRNPKTVVYILAPTNKALDVLREKCGHLADQYSLSFFTVDSFLGNRIKKNDDMETVKSVGKGQENPDLIVCDEGSMLKKEYDDRIRGRRVKTLYIGDPAQLPPINEEISSIFNIPAQFEMTEVVRYEGAIIKVATFLRERIQSGDMFLLQDLMGYRDEERTLTFIEKYNMHDWLICAVQKGLDARIVAFENATVNEHNSTIHRILFPNDPLFGVGEKVVVNETFEMPTGEKDSKGHEIVDMLYNGEMLTVLSCEFEEHHEGVPIYKVEVGKQKKVVLHMDGTPAEDLTADYTLRVTSDEAKCLTVHKALTNEIWEARRNGRSDVVKGLLQRRAPLNKLAPLRHSYSCTVHKSQGSTYDVAFCDWSSIYRSKDRARMMYVATTRPSKYLVVAAR